MKRIITLGALSLLFPLLTPSASAHCDTLQGPVVVTARAALAKGDVTPVLKWVQPADEPAIRTAFERTLAVRKQSTAAAELADGWFFETLVRIHRAAEGASFTGLKAEPPEPGAEIADAALRAGNLDAALGEISGGLQHTLKAKFDRVRSLQAHSEESVTAGRAYVAAYVDYIHFVEQLAALAHGGAPDAHHVATQP